MYLFILHALKSRLHISQFALERNDLPAVICLILASLRLEFVELLRQAIQLVLSSPLLPHAD